MTALFRQSRDTSFVNIKNKRSQTSLIHRNSKQIVICMCAPLRGNEMGLVKNYVNITYQEQPNSLIYAALKIMICPVTSICSIHM